MYPKLFEIPYIHLTISSFGPMMVVGFLAALTLIRRLSRDIIPDRQVITNAALYALIAGVLGARAFYVIHHFDQFEGEPLISYVATWKGGLELYGGVLLAIAVIVFYLWRRRLPMRRSLDILAIGLMLALVGRVGCFLNGCCFGRPTDLPWGVRFPYGSFAYRSQVKPDPKRNRPQPHMELPDEFFNFAYTSRGSVKILKPYEDLTAEQKEFLKEADKLRSLPVHPTQLYSVANGLLLCLVLYWFWRRGQRDEKSRKFCTQPGCTFSLMFILYGATRFVIEGLRDDNPFEFDSTTISQIIGIPLIVVGAVLLVVFHIKGRAHAKR
jgi:phosphatidylglycerol:prolipoprotein diacylglycerol transferase